MRMQIRLYAVGSEHGTYKYVRGRGAARPQEAINMDGIREAVSSAMAHTITMLYCTVL
jgi:hypothetical protein